MIEEYLLAVRETVKDHCSSIAQFYLENTLLVLMPPCLSTTLAGHPLTVWQDSRYLAHRSMVVSQLKKMASYRVCARDLEDALDLGYICTGGPL